MKSVDDVRSLYPEGTKDLSDAEIIFRVARATDLDPEQVAKDFGIADPRNAPRGALGFFNDSAINFSNSAVGLVGAAADFIKPGNAVSALTDKFLDYGEQRLSLQERLSQDRFSKGIQNESFMDSAGAVLDRVVDSPVQTLSQALGNLAPTGLGINAATNTARVLGVGSRAADNAMRGAQRSVAELYAGSIPAPVLANVGRKASDKAITGVGLGAGSALNAAMSGGEAARTAYDLVLKETGSEELATRAARQASFFPGLVGSLSGRIGVDRLFAGQGQALGKGASILKTAGVEFGSELVDEGVSAYSGRKVASLYDDSINPMTGVLGQSLMGGVQGGLMGASVAAANKLSNRNGSEFDQAFTSNNIVGGAGGLNGGMGNLGGTEVKTIEQMAAEVSAIQKAERDAQEQAKIQAKAQADAQKNATLAAANQQVNQAQANKQQSNTPPDPAAAAAAAVQTAQQLFDNFGIRTVFDQQTGAPTNKFVFGDREFFTEGDAMDFAKAMGEAGKDLSPLQQSLAGKLFAAGVVEAKSTDTAKAVVNRAQKFMVDNQLSSATSLEEVVSRIDSIIEHVGPKTDLNSNKVSPQAQMLRNMDKLREAISGEPSTRIGEIAEAQMMELQQKEDAKKAAKKPPAAKATAAPSAPKDTATAAPSGPSSIATGASIAAKDTLPGPVTSIQPPAATTGFKTAKGSVYAIDEQGRSIRTKNSEGEGKGTTYEPHPVLYVDSKDSQKILEDMRENLSGDLSIRIGYTDKGKFTPTTDFRATPSTGVPAVAVMDKKKNTIKSLYPAKYDPEVGLAPIEKLYKDDGTSSTHVGNKITELTTGASNGLQEQSTPGMGEVSEQGSAGSTVSPANGDARPTSVQPVGSGSVVSGSNGQQNDTGRGTGNEQRTVQPTANGANANAGAQNSGQEVNSGTQTSENTDGKSIRRSDTGTTQNTQGEARSGTTADTGGSTSSSGDGSKLSQVGGQKRVRRAEDAGATRAENERKSEKALAKIKTEAEFAKGAFRKVLEYVFITAGGSKGRETARQKVEFFDRFMAMPEEQREARLPEIAKELGVALGTVKGWSATLQIDPKTGQMVFSAMYAKRLEAGYTSVAAQGGMTVTELQNTLRDNASVESMVDGFMQLDDMMGDDSLTSQVAAEFKDLEGSEDRNTAYLNEQLGDADSGDTGGASIVDTPGQVSLSEQYNDGEGFAGRFEKITARIKKAQGSGDAAGLEKAQADLAVLLKDAKKENTARAKDSYSRKDTEVSETKEAPKAKVAVKPKSKKLEKPQPDKAPTDAPTETIKTSAEKYAAVVENVPGAPAFNELTKAQQDKVTDLAQREQLNLAAINKIVGEDVQATKKDIPELSTDDNGDVIGERETVASVKAEIKSFIGGLNDSRLMIVETADQLPKDIRDHPNFDPKARGVVSKGKAYLIANNIPKGRARAIFMHEVGSHLGIQRLLSDTQFDKIVSAIVAWAKKQDDSIESRVAVKALGRVFTANPTANQRNTELVAYFLEEAINMGVDPTALNYKSEFGRWFRAVYAAMKTAIRKLGFNSDKLTAQDMVDMAYGAAKLEISGSWHGTAAKFRKFNHAFMNSGEGAQAFGWGTYLAQRFGIGKDYQTKDVIKKTRDQNLKVLKAYEGWTVGDIIDPNDLAGYPLGGHVITENNVRSLSNAFANLGLDELILKKDGESKTVFFSDVRGSLHRTDHNVAEDAFLYHDKKISEQSDRVKNVVEQIREEIGTDNFDELLDIINIDFDKMDGKDLYDLLKRASLEGMMESDSEAVIKAQEMGQDDRAASMYLDEKGINGIKFLDRPSRDAVDNEKKIKRAQNRVDQATTSVAMYKDLVAARRLALKNYQMQKQDVSRDEGMITVMKDAIKNYEDILKQEESRLADKKDRLEVHRILQKEFGVPTHNLVIFNDKNIQRVATARGGDLNDMQFSKGEDETQKITPTQQRKIERNLLRVPAKARPFFNAFAKAGSRALNHLRFTGHLLQEAAKTMPSAQKYLNLVREQVAMRTTELHRVEKISTRFDNLDKPMKAAVNSLVHASTTSGKWAFAPSWLAGDEKVVVDPTLETKFNKLSSDAKQVVKDVFAHGYVTLARLKNAAREQVNTLYDEEITKAKKDNDTESVKELEAEKATQLGDFQKLFDTNANKPYTPLRRYGKHVVTFRSGTMQDAMDVVEAHREGEGISDEDLKNAREFIRTHEGDPKHYQVYFRESAIEAERLGETLTKENGSKGQVQQFTRDEAAQQLYTSSDMHGLMYRLRKKADDLAENGNQNDAAARQLSRLMATLHVSLMAEGNARQSENRRAEGTVTGADQNMMRSFHQHGMATASLLASLHKSKDVQKALEGFEKEAKNRRNPDREKAESLYNEVAARHAMGLEGQDTPGTDRILRYNSAFMLLSRPVYYLQNGLQPWFMTLPVLMGRYGPIKASGELFTAYTDVGKVLTTDRLTADVIAKLPKDVQKLVGDLLDSGRLNISLNQDMGDRLKGTNPVDNVITKLQGLAERVEGINRVTTAIAAYRLARKDNKSHDAAVKYAGDMVYDTHGDYSGFSAPRLMRTQVGRVATQFRKFQLIQIGLLAKLGRESFLDKNMSADEKFIARKALAYTLGTTFAMGGMTALPGFAAVAWVVGKIFGSADEPNDPEAQLARLRRRIGDPDLANLLLEGTSKSLFGFDSEPLGGWGNMMSLIPYTKVESADRSTYMNILLGLSGPAVGGLGPKMWTGMGKFAEGDVTGGLAQVLPTGIGNVVRALELADKGVTRPNGAQILSPDDVSNFTVVMQALGLRADEMADTQFINRVTVTYDAYYRDESSKVKKQYTEAFKNGDSQTMKDARERWTELNDSRRRNGFPVQPLSGLLKSPLTLRKYERKLNYQLDKTGQDLAGMR